MNNVDNINNDDEHRDMRNKHDETILHLLNEEGDDFNQELENEKWGERRLVGGQSEENFFCFGSFVEKFRCVSKENI